MPTLDWIGKNAVENHDKEIPYRLIKCEETIGDPESGNMIIQGDNLEALKALLPYYAGQIKCICIDPPYNTGSEGWIYNDNVNSPAIREWLNKTVGNEGEDLSRHDKWLCMMYPRLKLLHKFLKKEGVIFINIDDNEYANLKLLMDEIFGNQNFITNIVVKMSHLSGVKMSHVAKKLPKLKEYVLMYARDKNAININPAYEITEWNRAFPRYKSFLIYDEQDKSNILKWSVITLKEAFKLYEINDEDKVAKDKFCFENAHRIFRTARNRSDTFMTLPRDDKFREIISATGLKKIAYKKEEVLFASFKIKNTNEDSNIMEPLGDMWTDIGINNLHNEGGVIFRNGKKPLKLLKRLLDMGSNDGDIVLDSFAGSGTTGHAIMELNNNQRKRKFILIELDSKVCNEITRKRLENAYHENNSKIINDNTNISSQINNGFRYCKLDKSLFDEFGNISSFVKFKDLAYHLFFSETGTPLDKNPQNTKIGVFHGVAYYLLFNGILGDKSINGGNILTSKVLDKLPKHQGKKVIFGEGCRLGMQRLGKENIIFKQLPYEIKVN